jgi:hypothetical protein
MGRPIAPKPPGLSVHVDKDRVGVGWIGSSNWWDRVCLLYRKCFFGFLFKWCILASNLSHFLQVSVVDSEVFMFHVHKIDTSVRAQVERFLNLHYRLYQGTPQWVPPIRDDIRMMLNRSRHPYYEHSDADFFIVTDSKDDEVLGRIAVMENKAFNRYHDTRKANFYLFDSVNDQQVADTLFDAAFDWCRKRDLDTVIGPKGFSLFDGYGIQIEGQEHRQMMTMMNYNFPYYQTLAETAGFTKEVDFVSCYIPVETFEIPEKMREVARRVAERGKFRMLNFKNKRDLIRNASAIGRAYNDTFVNNWEYWPLTDREIQFVVDAVLMVAVPQLIKIMMYNEKIVGFLFGFPDVSAALKRHNGNVAPWNVVSIADVLLDLRRTRWISLNGAGVLPEYHGRGGNALMYYEMEKTMKSSRYVHGELTQVAETAVQMRKDLITAGGKAYKNHRVFRYEI